STIASVPRGLLFHYLWIAIIVSSPAFISSVRFWLRRRIVRPRHSRHIIVGINMPVPVSTRTAKSMLIAVANSASNRTYAWFHGPTSHRRRFVMISSGIAVDNSPVCWRNRSMKSRRRIHQPRPAIPSAPAARRPAPAAPVHKYPPAIPIRHPAPWIRGNPRISKTGRIAPVAVAKWVPVISNIVRLPDFAVSRHVIILAVIIQVACAVLIRRLRIALAGRSILTQSVVALRAPLVQIVGVHAFIQGIARDVVWIQDKCLILLYGNFAAIVHIAHAHFALQHRNFQRIGIGAGYAE